jgi:hypothetical protein
MAELTHSPLMKDTMTTNTPNWLLDRPRPTGLGALTGHIDLQSGHTTPVFQGNDYTRLSETSSPIPSEK